MFAAGYPAWKKIAGPAPKTAAVSIKAGAEEGSIDIENLKKIVAENPESILLVDVRDKKEYEKGHFKAAINVTVDDLEKVAHQPSVGAMKLAQAFWPGPLTLVVPRHPDLPDNLAPRPTFGVRIPDHPVALELLRKAGPLAVTSANLSGQDNTSTAEEVLVQLGGRVHLVLDGGQTPGGGRERGERGEQADGEGVSQGLHRGDPPEGRRNGRQRLHRAPRDRAATGRHPVEPRREL